MNELFKKVKNICYSNNFSSLYRQIESIENKMKDGNFIDIAILGQFKSGKSSFINSLLGEKILPVGVIPVTSVITRIFAGDKKKVNVIFNDNNLEEVSVNAIDNYITEKKNPKNEKNVFLVDVQMPDISEYNKLRFIDTPGIGSFFKHNTETTENWFSEIGVAIVTISAERPLGENEINLIKEISEHCPEIVILLTKVDLFADEQVEEIFDYVKKSLQKEFKRNFQVYCYSTVKECESYKQKIQEDVIFPLVNKFDSEQNRIIEHKIRSLVKSTLNYLQIEYKIAQNNEIQKLNLKEQILEEQLNKSFLAQELRLIASNQKGQTREKVFDILQKYENQLVDDLRKKFKEDYKSWNENLNKVARKFEKWIKENLTIQFEKILGAEYQQFAEIVNSNKKHFQYFIKSFRDRLNSNIEKVLNVKMLQEDFEFEIKALKKPNISISWSFEFHLDLIWFLFPMFIFKNIFRRHFLNLIEYEVNKNIHRVTSELNLKIHNLISEYEKQALNYISNELKTIESVLSRAKFESKHYLDLMNSLRLEE